MKKIIVILFVLGFSISLFGQTQTKSATLPANLAKWNKIDSNDLLNNPTIKSRLKKLLGKKNYADFKESWETINPVVKNGNFLFSSGCLIHACGHLESAIAIDLVNNSIHAAIYNQAEKTRYFNEGNRKTPKAIKNWAKRLALNQ